MTRIYYEDYTMSEYLEYLKMARECPEFAKPSKRASWIGCSVDAENGFLTDEPFNPPP